MAIRNTLQHDQGFKNVTDAVSSQLVKIIPQEIEGVEYLNTKGRFVRIDEKVLPLSKAIMLVIFDIKVPANSLICTNINGKYYSDLVCIDNAELNLIIHKKNKNII